MLSHHDLDPRAKLALALSVSAIAIAIPELPALAGLFATLAVVAWSGDDLGLREWLGFLSPFRYLIPLILVLNAFFYGSGEVLWTLWLGGFPVRLTTGGIEASVVIAGRLLVIAGAAAWFSSTTDPEEFEVALVRLGVPWSFAFVLSLTLRIVPTMRRKLSDIEEAQRSRGLEISGGPVSRAKARIPMLIPFFVAVIQYGYELSEALAIRHYGHARHRTHYIELRHRPIDYAIYAAAVGLVVAFVAAFGI